MTAPRMRFEPGAYDAAQATIDELTDRYEAWFRARDPGADIVDVSNLQLILEWKIGWVDGLLDEWVGDDVEEFLIEWCPRKVSVPADMALEMADSVAQAFTFLGDEGLLSSRSHSGRALAAHARSLGPDFLRSMADPAKFGMAKSLLGGVGGDFGEDLTPERLSEVMEQFNALPYEQRAAITGPFLGDAAPEQPVIGPVVLPPEDDVRASAAAAPVLTVFSALCDYFKAPGRPLTAKGNIKLADAQALSGIIGSEPLEETFGHYTHHRHSSASMPNLDHWQWWARQSGAIRVNRGRMVGVKAWRTRCEKDPVGEATKAFEILMSHGVIGSYLAYRLWSGPEVIDRMAGSLLAMLMAADDRVEFTTLVDTVLRVREDMGLRPLFDNPDLQAGQVRGDVDLMLTMLERAGVVEQHDLAYEPSHYHERRTGGTVELTAFGVVKAVGEARAAGIDVQIIDSPADLEVHNLADLAVREAIDVESWLDLLVAWVGQQEDGRLALTRLFEALEGSTLLIVLGLTTPDELIEDFAAVLQNALDTRPPYDPLAAAAIGWLAEHERLDPARVNPETIALSRLSVLCLLAATDPAAVPEMMGATQSRGESLADVAEASRLMPPNVEALLDAIGRYHPDKVVAKSGRRELLRVRSRLVNQRRD